MRAVRYVALLVVLVVNSVAIHLLHPVLVLLRMLRVCPHTIYDASVEWSKRAYVDVLHLICLLFPSPHHSILLSCASCSLSHLAKLLVTRRVVVIANHQSYLDWFYVWIALAHFDCHHLLRIVLKHSLRFLPLFGTAMMVFDFVFLKRKWALDAAYLTAKLKTLPSNTLLLLFPEGTVINPKTMKQSEEFAKKHDMICPKFTLLPKSTDITMAFSNLPSPSTVPEQHFTLRSVFIDNISPSPIHMRMTLIKPSSMSLSSKETFSKSLNDLFLSKSKELELFHRTGSLTKGEKKETVEYMLGRGHSYRALIQVWCVWVVVIVMVQMII